MNPHLIPSSFLNNSSLQNSILIKAIELISYNLLVLAVAGTLNKYCEEARKWEDCSSLLLKFS